MRNTIGQIRPVFLIDLLKIIINIGSFVPNVSISLRTPLVTTVTNTEKSFYLSSGQLKNRSTHNNDRCDTFVSVNSVKGSAAIEHRLCRELDIENDYNGFCKHRKRRGNEFKKLFCTIPQMHNVRLYFVILIVFPAEFIAQRIK